MFASLSRVITSYHLPRSFEGEMFERASRKLGLERAVLGAGDREDAAPDRAQLERLLKRGAYLLLASEESERDRSAAYADASIDTILGERATTWTVDGARSDAAFSSTVAATTHFGGNGSDGVRLDDPNFWSKIAGSLGAPASMPEPSPAAVVPTPVSARTREGRGGGMLSGDIFPRSWTYRRRALARVARFVADFEISMLAAATTDASVDCAETTSQGDAARPRLSTFRAEATRQATDAADWALDDDEDDAPPVFGLWTIHEDTALGVLVPRYGATPGAWAHIARHLFSQRTGKQCRERWFYYHVETWNLF
jgi:hypothetical protein